MRCASPHMVAVAPNSTSSIDIGSKAASKTASIDSTVPRYRWRTTRGCPLTLAVSITYQYAWPFLIFLCRNAIPQRGYYRCLRTSWILTKLQEFRADLDDAWRVLQAQAVELWFKRLLKAQVDQLTTHLWTDGDLGPPLTRKLRLGGGGCQRGLAGLLRGVQPCQMDGEEDE